MGTATPTEWARDKRRRAERYARDYLSVFRNARDVILPGVPVAAIIGAAMNGGIDENTTGWISGSAAERDHAMTVGRKPLGGDPREGYGHVGSKDLHECGPLGAEGNHEGEPVAGEGSTWARGARAASVRKVLSRDGVIGERWYGAVADQIAIGVWSLQQHGVSVCEKLRAVDPRLAWALDGDGVPKVWTLWSWAGALGGWSAGNGGIARHVIKHREKLVTVPEAVRFGVLCRLAGEVDDGGAKHKQDEYTALRTGQKFEGARLAVPLIPDEPWADAWLDDGLGADRDTVMARLAAVS